MAFVPDDVYPYLHELTRAEEHLYLYHCRKRNHKEQKSFGTLSECAEIFRWSRTIKYKAQQGLLDKGWIEKNCTGWILKKGDFSCQEKSTKRDEKSTKKDTYSKDNQSLPSSTNVDADKPQLETQESGKPSLPTKSEKEASKDARSSHVAIQFIRSLMRRYPDRELYDRIIKRFGAAFDEGKLRGCWMEWVERGNNKNSLKWLNWYFDGIPVHFTDPKTTKPKFLH